MNDPNQLNIYKEEVINHNNDIKIDVSSAQIDTPILIGHGKDDNVVPVEASKLAYRLLKKTYCLLI